MVETAPPTTLVIEAPPTPPHKRACIIGTAPSWRQAPWDDPSLTIVSLNDAHVMGLPRIDEWYDLHPSDHFWYRTKTTVDPNEVPYGHYIRPPDHLKWMQEAARTIPVWLHHLPEGEWPMNARVFPFEACELAFGRYFASSPAWMLAHLILRGFKDIQIFGIHLATEREYIEQRPNFEFLIGQAIRMGVQIRLPKESPILQAPWLYAKESRPMPRHVPAQGLLNKKAAERQKIIEQMAKGPFWARAGLRPTLKAIELEMMDLEQQVARAQCASTIAVPSAAVMGA